MKEIKAIIKPQMADAVVRALHELPHFPGLTLHTAHGQGRGRGAHQEYKPSVEDVFDHEVSRLEVVCADEMAGSIVDTIRQAAHTGARGDGIIVVTPIERVIRIRSGAEQEQAV
jgi:nitrogen regulatory protein P-II 1